MLVFCAFALAASPARAKDLCCIVACGPAPACHHWDTFNLWADTKCSALGILNGCNSTAGTEADVTAGNCLDHPVCTAQNTTNSPATKGKGQVCKKNTDCPGSTLCANLALRRNRCAVPCESDAECGTGEKCKKPLGSSFSVCR
jgi:hypothetical protein